MRFLIVIFTTATAKDGIYTTLGIFDIGSGKQHIGLAYLVIVIAIYMFKIVTNTTIEALITFTVNPSTKVVTAIHVVTDIGEAVVTDIGLSMTQDISVTATAEGVEHTSIVQIDDGITGYQTFETTTIDKLSLGHVNMVAIGTFRHTR